MKRILLLILILSPLVASAQRMELYTYNSFTYIALYAYGLPRSVVKSNAEMREAQWNKDGTGVMRRHHTTKGIDERVGDDGYNGNDKISFAFMVAPYNVNVDGEPVHNASDVVTWCEASGWDSSTADEQLEYDPITGVGAGVSTLAAEPSGCAAYKGMSGKEQGQWRLPTQREIQVMFTVIEQSLSYIESGAVEHEIIEGTYWTSTEFYASGDKAQAWLIDSYTGRPINTLMSNTGMARCVKDIYEPIND